MSGTAISKDTQCRSLGFVNNPKRGYFRTVKTCARRAPVPVQTPDRCRIIAKGEVFFDGLSPPVLKVAHFGVSAITHEGAGLVQVTLNTGDVPNGKRRFVSATVHNVTVDEFDDCAHILYAFVNDDDPTNPGPQTLIRFTTTIIRNFGGSNITQCVLRDRRFCFSVCECDDISILSEESMKP